MIVPALGGGRDPGRLLPAVLEREQGEVRQSGDVVLGCVDPEHAAFVAGAVAMVVPGKASRSLPYPVRLAAPRFTPSAVKRLEPALARAARNSETASVNAPSMLEL